MIMTRALTIDEYISLQADKLEGCLRESIPKEWDIPHVLREAMEYSLFAGGKRLRPVLMLAAAEAFGRSGEQVLPMACAVEMIHTYSLVHDDLPAMDNDDLRRGKPTNHKVFGEAMAILAGDGLLTHAFYQLVKTSRQAGIPAEQALAIVSDMSELAGPRGMVGGQAADMLGEQGITDLEQLAYIHAHKTADLIAFSVMAGGRIGGASEEQLEALRAYGSKLGLAFQIQDDILDVVGDEAKLGKPRGSDETKRKVTYPYFLGLDASRQLVTSLTDEAKAAASGLPNPGRLLELADYLMQREH